MNRVQSVDRAFLILQRIATSELGLTEIAEDVDLPKSTVARLLHTLASIGAVDRVSSDGTYRIGDAVRNLVGATPTVADFARHARPYMRMLAQEVGEDAGVSVPIATGVHYAAQESAENPVVVEDWTGTVASFHVVPAGLVILAFSPGAWVDRVLDGPLEAATPRTVTDPAAIRRRLAQIRADGYCWVYGEFLEELNSVAAPVFGVTGLIGAIGVHGPSYRFPKEGEEGRIAGRVVDVAAKLSEAHSRAR